MVYHSVLAKYFVSALAVIDRNFSYCYLLYDVQIKIADPSTFSLTKNPQFF